MTTDDVFHVLPLIVLAAGAVVGMLGIAAFRSHIATFLLTLTTLILSMVALRFAARVNGEHVAAMIRLDGYAILLMILLFSSAIAVVVMAYGYMRERAVVREEFYILTLTAMLGCGVLVSSVHFASFFIGLELLTVSLYALVAYNRAGPTDAEAAIKYFLPAAASSAFLLFGMAMVYARSGTMMLSTLAGLASSQWQGHGLLALAGLGMILVGVAFKLALVPFHLWAADVYEGAPAPVTALIATASKGAVFALLLRYFDMMSVQTRYPFFTILAAVAIATMFVGNYLALLQRDLKRLLAYSSIAHIGYLLVAFLAGGPLAVTAVIFYLLTYFITVCGAFAVIAALSGGDKDFSAAADYRALAHRHPVLAAVLAAMLLSLAGMPLTAGFLGKFFIVLAGVQAGLWALVLVLVVNSVIALFYYLRVVVLLYQPVEPQPPVSPAAVRPREPAPCGSFIGGVVLAGLVLSLFWVGVYPGPIIHFIEDLTGGLM
jgi:NADH-quinone oxidoreductase subunit N